MQMTGPTPWSEYSICTSDSECFDWYRTNFLGAALVSVGVFFMPRVWRSALCRIRTWRLYQLCFFAIPLGWLAWQFFEPRQTFLNGCNTPAKKRNPGTNEVRPDVFLAYVKRCLCEAPRQQMLSESLQTGEFRTNCAVCLTYPNETMWSPCQTLVGALSLSIHSGNTDVGRGTAWPHQSLRPLVYASR